MLATTETERVAEMENFVTSLFHFPSVLSSSFPRDPPCRLCFVGKTLIISWWFRTDRRRSFSGWRSTSYQPGLVRCEETKITRGLTMMATASKLSSRPQHSASSHSRACHLSMAILIQILIFQNVKLNK